jgi:predicted RNA-binding protein associated with RNAse of E/G family
MTLHPPKHISSIVGLGLNTTKMMRRINNRISIGTEVWNDMQEPWREGETIIAEPGYIWTTKWEVDKPYIITKFQDADSNLIAIYCDVARPIKAVGNGFTFTDLYLDVWQIPGQEPVVLDEDELKAAVKAGFINSNEASEACRVANELVAKLKNDPGFLKFSTIPKRL